MSLTNTSNNNNFLAKYFNFNPSKIAWKYKIDAMDEQFIKDYIAVDIVEVWNFGLGLIKSLPQCIAQIEFVFPGTTGIDDDNYKIVTDSWAYTNNQLCNKAKDKKLFICIHASYLANLNDPRPLLKSIKRICLDENSTHIIIIKDQTVDSHYLRKWSDSEFEKFLIASGFSVKLSKSINLLKTYFIISIESELYDQYIQSLGLTRSVKDCKQVVIYSNERSLYSYDGVDNYIENFKSLNRHSVYLNCNVILRNNEKKQNSLLLSEVIECVDSEQVRNGIDYVEAVKVILYALPYIEVCAFQDNSNVSFRVVQAKQTGQLPQNLYLRLIISGNVDYKKYTEQTYDSSVYDLTNIRNVIKDEFIYKYVDETRYSCAYLYKLMSKEFGYYLNNPQFERLPFDLEQLTKLKKIKINTINKIIFIGEYGCRGEWTDFKELINDLNSKNLLANINEIICVLAKEEKDIENIEINSSCRFTKKIISSDEKLTFIANLSNESLFILPTRNAGQPYTLLSLLLIGSRFITYSSHVYQEFINTIAFRELFVVENDVNNLIKTTKYILSQSVKDYEDILSEECRITNELQVIASRYYQEANEHSTDKNSEINLDQSDLSITVTSPIYNTPIPYLEELLQSICCSSLIPYQWLLIDDGSKPEYSEKLEDFVLKNQNKINIRLKKQINGGAAAARNSALKESISKFTFYIDADDVLLPHTLMHSLIALKCSPELVAVGSISVDFVDAQSMPKNIAPIKNHAYWAPLGVPEAKILSLLENQFISACILVDTQKIKQMGGWDQQDKSAWDDWAFYSQLAWSNLRFSLMPIPGFLYRNTPGSITKTYNQYLGRRRLIRNVPGMSRQDVKILSAMALSADPRGPRGEHRLEVLLQNILNSRSWKITSPLRSIGYFIKSYKINISSFVARLFK